MAFPQYFDDEAIQEFPELTSEIPFSYRTDWESENFQFLRNLDGTFMKTKNIYEFVFEKIQKILRTNRFLFDSMYSSDLGVEYLNQDSEIVSVEEIKAEIKEALEVDEEIEAVLIRKVEKFGNKIKIEMVIVPTRILETELDFQLEI